MKNFSKRLTLILMVVTLIMPNLTACGTSLTMYATTSLPQAIKARAEANKQIALDMYEAGILSKKTFNDLWEHIDSQEKIILGDLYAEDGKNIELDDAAKNIASLADAVTYYKLYRPYEVTYTDSNDQPKTELVPLNGKKGDENATKYATISRIDTNTANPNSYSYFVISNYIAGEVFGLDNNGCDDSGCNKHRPKINIKGTDHPDENAGKLWYESHWSKNGVNGVTPINFFTTEAEEEFEKLFSAQLYVFDANSIDTSNKSMSEVMAAIKKATDNKDTTALNKYFKPLLDENGDPVYLIDKQVDIIGNSKKHPTIGKGLDSSKRVENKPGYDLIVTQTFDNVERNVLSIRFKEFNAEAVENLTSEIGLNKDKYYFVSTDGGCHAYLFEYPVSVIKSFDKTTIDNVDYVAASLSNESGLGINIKSGEIIRYDQNGNGEYLASGTAIPNSDAYLTCNFADGEDTVDASSFVAKGVTKYTIDVGSKKATIYGPQIVLRDYLEATWAPGSTKYDNEPLVVFGRKIRFFTGTNYWKDVGDITIGNTTVGTTTYDKWTLAYKLNDSDNVASFVGFDGTEISTSPSLKITDFCDINSILGIGNEATTVQDDFGDTITGTALGTTGAWDKYIVKSFATANESTEFIQNSIPEDETTPSIEELSINKNVNTIRVSKRFPGEYIGATDKDNPGNTVERFYCVATTKGLFESALYSDWINSTASTASLEWWNSYLGEKGYNYYIGHDKVNEYLQGNYQYELSQSGVVILDLETIGKIQEIMDDEAGIERNSLIRTLFIVIGIVIMAYCMILMLCWVIDTHADIGVSLLNKASLGNWTAVASTEDVPDYTDGDKQYITGGRLILKCLWMIALAIVCIRVNIIDVVLRLISFIGPVAEYIQNMIMGR